MGHLWPNKIEKVGVRGGLTRTKETAGMDPIDNFSQRAILIPLPLPERQGGISST